MEWAQICQTLTTSLNQVTQALEKERSKKRRCRVDSTSGLLFHLVKFIETMEVDDEDAARFHAKLQHTLQTLLAVPSNPGSGPEAFYEHLSRVEVLFGEAIDFVSQEDIQDAAEDLKRIQKKRHVDP